MHAWSTNLRRHDSISPYCGWRQALASTPEPNWRKIMSVTMCRPWHRGKCEAYTVCATACCPLRSVCKYAYCVLSTTELEYYSSVLQTCRRHVSVPPISLIMESSTRKTLEQLLDRSSTVPAIAGLLPMISFFRCIYSIPYLMCVCMSSKIKTVGDYYTVRAYKRS